MDKISIQEAAFPHTRIRSSKLAELERDRARLQRIEPAARKALRMGRAYMEYHRGKMGASHAVGMTPALDELEAAMSEDADGE